MIFSLKNISEFFKNRKMVSGQNSYRNTNRDWVTIFSILVLMFLLTFVSNFYIFFGIQKGTLFPEPEETNATVKNVSAQKLDEALRLIMSREKRFEELRVKKVIIRDPSI